jgi:hypothetical protein
METESSLSPTETPVTQISPPSSPSQDPPPSDPSTSPSSPLPSPELTKEQKREKRRICVVNEILSSENTYLSRLRITMEIFILPLKEKNILINDDFKKQFSNFEIIRELHERLFAALMAAKEQHLDSVNNIQIGKVFKEFSGFFKMYKEYLASYEGSIVRLAKLVTSNRKFVQFLENARADPRSLGMGIDSFLMEPVQRIPRYRMLLEELLKYTAQENEDYPNIAAALDIVRSLPSSPVPPLPRSHGP